jgi:hypothetical protein
VRREACWRGRGMHARRAGRGRRGLGNVVPRSRRARRLSPVMHLHWQWGGSALRRRRACFVPERPCS